MKEFIIKIRNAAISKIVQKKLFKEGYGWGLEGSKKVDFHYFPLQFRVDKTGEISFLVGDYSVFLTQYDSLPRLTLEELFTMKFEEEILS